MTTEQTDFKRWEIPNFLKEDVRITPEEIERIKQEARKEGFDLGKAEGLTSAETYLAEAKQHLESEKEMLKRIIEKLEDPLAFVSGIALDNIVALLFTVAKKLLRRELETEKEVVTKLVKEAIACLAEHKPKKLMIYLNPADKALVSDALIKTPEDAARYQIFEDTELARGDARVETEHASVDTNFERRFDSVFQAFFEIGPVSDAEKKQVKDEADDNGN